MQWSETLIRTDPIFIDKNFPTMRHDNREHKFGFSLSRYREFDADLQSVIYPSLNYHTSGVVIDQCVAFEETSVSSWLSRAMKQMKVFSLQPIDSYNYPKEFRVYILRAIPCWTNRLFTFHLTVVTS